MKTITFLDQENVISALCTRLITNLGANLNNLKIDIIKKDSKKCLKCLNLKKNPKTLDSYMIPLDSYMIPIRLLYDSLDSYMIPLDSYMSLTTRLLYESKWG
ncbi:hypothetical protein DMW20_11990 [Vibrio parahaemolyticus]|nr:hypothetical protein [Vibrio parahaemolyticus]